jgi:hypothetical protein
MPSVMDKRSRWRLHGCTIALDSPMNPEAQEPPPNMLLISLTWLVMAPFAIGMLIARSRHGRRLVANCYWPCLALGWVGVALLVAGGLLLDGPVGAVALAAGAPLAGLSFWRRRGGGGGGGEPPEEPGPTPPGWDWERFYADLRLYTDARSGRSPGREPAPV